jgi:hypothetical protein
VVGLAGGGPVGLRCAGVGVMQIGVQDEMYGALEPVTKTVAALMK